jgi:HSP20 family protein
MVWHDWTRTFDWDPWAELDRFQNEWQRRMGAELAAQDPPVRVYSGDASVVVYVELPGREPGDIDLTVTDDRLVLRGKQPEQRGDDERRTERQEFAPVAFERAFELPWTAASDAVQASFRNGILRIEVPRVAQERPRRIPIAAT